MRFLEKQVKEKKEGLNFVYWFRITSHIFGWVILFPNNSTAAFTKCISPSIMDSAWQFVLSKLTAYNNVLSNFESKLSMLYFHLFVLCSGTQERVLIFIVNCLSFDIFDITFSLPKEMRLWKHTRPPPLIFIYNFPGKKKTPKNPQQLLGTVNIKEQHSMLLYWVHPQWFLCVNFQEIKWLFILWEFDGFFFLFF